MKANQAPKQAGVPATGRGRQLAELRRSSAAGRHGRRRADRYNSNRRAIAADYRAG